MKWSKINSGYNVLIKKDAIINYPKICAVCGKYCDDHKMEITGSNVEPFWRWKRIYSVRPNIMIPAHPACANIHQRNSSLRIILNFSIIITSAIAVYSITGSFDRWLFTLPFVPLILINRFVMDIFWYTESITFSVDNDRYDFIFKNKKYAHEFEILNSNNLYERRLLKNFGATKRS